MTRKKCKLSEVALCKDCANNVNDCPLYVCQDDKGFLIACCIVYAYIHRLTILGLFKVP
jgi:hypothetical protein